MSKIKLAILKNEVPDDHILWEKACEEMRYAIDYSIIDVTKNDWLEKIQSGSFSGLLVTPTGYTTVFKTLFDERMKILNSVCRIPIFPSLEEILIYENKKYFSYWLKANKIPHPKTDVFYFENEASAFLNTVTYPIVAKTNIGAGGSGVIFIANRKEGENYIRHVFSGKGIGRRAGPKWRKKGFFTRVLAKLMRPGELKLKLSKYKIARSEVQKDFVLFQEFIPHEYEWRCVRMGDSYFAHKKMVNDGMASGSLLKGYETPPFDLLDFVKEITDRHNFLSQAVDVFVTADGSYLVNEMQCIFGQSDPFQMLINGEPGRYRFIDENWIFESGDFNKHESFLLRLETFIKILNEKTTEKVL